MQIARLNSMLMKGNDFFILYSKASDDNRSKLLPLLPNLEPLLETFWKMI